MKKNMVVLCVLILSILNGIKAKAETVENFDNYYTVHESPVPTSSGSHIDPLETLQGIFSDEFLPLVELRSAVISLLTFDHHKSNFGEVNEPYSRLKQFGTWVRDRNDNSCLNTRAQVLVRDSQGKVSYTSTGCTVASGRWMDPYSARTITDAGQIDIDHFVPLKNAYMSGAHKWDYTRRCLYANYRGNSFHLLPVYDIENKRKGDKSPEGYMPPNKAYQCQYLSNWLKVKLIWSLEVTPPERETLLKLAQANHCPASTFEYKAQELDLQRQTMNSQADLCR